MTSEEKIREEFESFYLGQDQSAKEHLDFIRDDGEYGYHVTRCAWNAWKASRESLVIPLPHSANGYMDGCSLELELMDADEVRESIHAAGVKTK